MGTGGGGELSEGIGLIDQALDAGKQFRLQSLADAPDNALAATPYMLGAISALPAAEEAQYARLPRAQGHAILRAYERLESYLGQRLYGTLACELGGVCRISTGRRCCVAVLSMTIAVWWSSRAVPAKAKNEVLLKLWP